MPRTVQIEANASSVAAIFQLVGNSPLLELRYSYDGEPRRVYAKYDPMNMTGSVKDRMAMHILRTAYEADELHPGDTIAEASSGNTGISFAAIGRALRAHRKYDKVYFGGLKPQSQLT